MYSQLWRNALNLNAIFIEIKRNPNTLFKLQAAIFIYFENKQIEFGQIIRQLCNCAAFAHSKGNRGHALFVYMHISLQPYSNSPRFVDILAASELISFSAEQKASGIK